MERNEKEEKEGVGGVIREGGWERGRKGMEGWEGRRRTGMNEKGRRKCRRKGGGEGEKRGRPA